MFKALKRLFCKHDEFKEDKSIRSSRLGNDNHVIQVTIHECVKCGKTNVYEIIDKIEKDWYVN